MESVLAPEWQIRTLNGEAAPKLTDLRGKPVLIMIFSRGCPGCMGRAIPITKELQTEFPELQIVGIHTHFEGSKFSLRQIEEVGLFFKLDYPVYVDQEKATYEMFEAGGTPHWVLIDGEGMIIKSIFGSMGNSKQRLVYSIEELFQEGE